MRCNVGVNPKYLTDQWLIAEYRELPMVVGSLRVNGWKIKSEAFKRFDLGKGHINWFKSRLLYLFRRHEEVKKEMVSRGFKCDVLNITKEPGSEPFWNDWNPTMEDSVKLRQRLEQKILDNNNNRPISWWRYNGVNLTHETVNSYLDLIRNGEMYFV